jgi:hypothetical protein
MKSMKKTTRALVLSLLAVIALAFTACQTEADEDTMTVAECMSEFQSAVNSSNWTALKALTHSGSTQYSTMTSASWIALFTATDFAYTVSGTDATVTCNSIGYTFSLKEDGSDNYKIYKIILSASPYTVKFD